LESKDLEFKKRIGHFISEANSMLKTHEKLNNWMNPEDTNLIIRYNLLFLK
jgi:hypothetical protein